MTRLHAFLCAAMLCAAPALADPLSEARAAYQAAEADKKALDTGIAEKQTALIAEKRALETRVTTRMRLEAEVTRQRSDLLRQKLAVELQLGLAARYAEQFATQWQAVLARPQTFSSEERRAIRDGLAHQRRLLATARADVEALNRKITERNEALAAAALDIDHTRAITDSDARIFLLQTDLGLLNERALAKLQIQKAALESFLQASREGAPPVIDAITISGPDGLVFQGVWAPVLEERAASPDPCGHPPIKGPPPGEGTPIHPSRLAAHLAELSSQVTAARGQIDRNAEAITGYTRKIADFITEQEKLSNEYARLYQDIAGLENAVLAVNTVVDIGVVIAEVALTGGAATAARTGAQIGADQLGKIAARKIREKVGEAATARLAGKTMTEARSAFIEAAAREAPRAIAQTRGMDAIRREAAELFDTAAQAAFDEQFKKLVTGRAGAVFLRKKATALAQSATPDLPIAQTAGNRALKSLGGDLLEFGFDRTFAIAAYKGSEIVPKTGKGWVAAGKLIKGIKPQNLKDLLPNNPADVTGIVGSAAKAAFTYGIGLEIDEATQTAIRLQAEYAALWKIHDQMFRKRLDLQTNRTNLQALILRAEEERQAILSGTRSQRQLYTPVTLGLSDPEATYVIKLRFSKPLVTGPKVTFGGVKIQVTTQPTALASAEWSAALPEETLRALKPDSLLEISAQDGSGQQLDSSPASLPVAQLDGQDYHLYAPGPDRCYRVDTDLRRLTLEFEGLEAEFRTR